LHFSFLVYFDNLPSACFEQSKYSSPGGSYDVYAAYGIYHAENILKFWKLLIYTLSLKV